MQRTIKSLINLAVSIALVAAVYGAAAHRYEILDWWFLRSYTPPTRIAALADQATMTDVGRRLFYRAQPQIDADRAALTRDCRIDDDKTIELGCYLSNDKLYLLDIQQPELADEMIVTAAHETLHAAYDRYSAAERKTLNAQLQQAAASITDPKLKERLADYQKIEPGEQDNELHSILGTEFGNLPPALEEHYAQYFANRSQLVAYNAAFNRTFDGLHQQIVSLDARIKSEKAQMDALLASRQISAYNGRVPGVNSDIESYNSKVEQYNRYASQLLGTESTQPSQ
jgi:hypothetical protein